MMARKFFIILLSCYSTEILLSQSIQLVLSPNPSPYISDWQSRAETARLIISNPTANDISVKVKTELYDGRGTLIAYTNAAKMPVLTISPGISQYNAEDIFPVFALNYSGNLERIVTRTGRIPDDTYRFCVTLTEPRTNTPIGTSGTVCRMFQITAYYAPILITPFDKSSITPDDARGILFRWTPVSPNPRWVVTYRLQIIEVLPGQEDMTALRNNLPIVEKDIRGAIQTQWPIDFAMPEPGTRYIWTVTPLDDEGRKMVDGHGFAQPFVFDVAGPSIRGAAAEQTGTAEVNDTIHAGANGEFKVILTSVSSESDGSLTGKGIAYVKWLGTNVEVEFQKIKINTDKKLIAGGITAIKSTGSGSSLQTYPLAWVQSLPSSPLASGLVDGVINWGNSQINNVIDWVNSQVGTSFPYQQIPASSIPSPPLKMPFGLQFDNAGKHKIIITEMVFNPNDSKINFLAQTKFSPSSTTYKLGFIGKYFIITQNSINFSSGRIELAEDIAVPNTSASPKMEYTFKKGSANEGCYIEWSEDGLSKIGLEIEVSFSREWLIPVPAQPADKKVKAKLSGNGSSIQDILLEGNLPLCEVAGVSGMKIQANSIMMDLSDIRNPSGLTFPEKYTGTTGVDWIGFYIKSFDVTLPDAWKTGNNTAPPKVTASHLIIDNHGLTTDIKALNVLNLQSGNIANLSASLDTLEVSLLNSSLTKGNAKGRLILPISEVKDGNTLKYTATFAQAGNTGTFQVVIVPYQEIEANILKGRMALKPSSNIKASLSSDIVSASIKLHGVFRWNNPDLSSNQSVNTGSATPIRLKGIKGVKMELSFEELNFEYKNDSNNDNPTMTFNIGRWSFASPQKWLANFPVAPKKIYYKSLATVNPQGGKELLRGAIMLDIVANLTEDIGGSTTVGAIFAVEFYKNPLKLKPAYKGVFVEKISVRADLSAVKISGSLDMYDTDPVFGDGFKAQLEVLFTAVSLKISALTQFGNTAYQNNGQLYRYWRVEADVKLPTGIPFLTGVGFYGFGGGAFYNMHPDEIPSISNPGNMAYTFKPKKSALGFVAKATIGTMPKFETFNADVSLLAAFSTSGGITQISFLGNLWLAASLQQRPQAKITGSVYVGYNFPDKIFNMAAGLKVNVPPSITTPDPAGAGFVMNINGRTNKWYFKCGTPAQTNRVRVFQLDMYSYLMFGNDIPAPNGFTPRFANNYRSVTGSDPSHSSVGTGGVGMNTTTGKGIATGIGIEFSQYLGKYLYKGVCRRWSIGGPLQAGAELNLALMHQTGCTGINGYRASGHLGLYAALSASIEGKSFKKDCEDKYWNLFRITAGAWVAGKFPNPEYLTGALTANINLFNGLCKTTYYQTFTRGTDCQGVDVVVNNAPQEDKADDLFKSLIQYIAPDTKMNFPLNSPINVKYGLVPGEIFDVAENQEDGTIKNRTFMLEVSASLEIKEANGNWKAVSLFNKVNNLGEYQYYTLGASGLAKYAHEVYTGRATENEKNASINQKEGSQLLPPNASAGVLELFHRKNVVIAKANKKLAETNLKLSSDIQNAGLGNSSKAQANFNQAVLNLQRCNTILMTLGRDNLTYSRIINDLQIGLDVAKANKQLAMANWQLATSSGQNIAPSSTGIRPGHAGDVSSPGGIQPVSTVNSDTPLVNSNGQITINQISVNPRPANEPNFPAPTPSPENELQQGKEYRFRVTANLKELLNNSWRDATNRKGEKMSMSKTFQFTTAGTLPIYSGK